MIRLRFAPQKGRCIACGREVACDDVCATSLVCSLACQEEIQDMLDAAAADYRAKCAMISRRRIVGRYVYRKSGSINVTTTVPAGV